MNSLAPAPAATFAGLAADTWGRSDARPPIVLLHGLTFDRSIWRPVAQELELADPARRVIAFDLPGHGSSPDLRSYRLPAIVARVHQAIEEAGADAPILVGHSISAVIATAYAGLHPTSGVVNVGQSLYVTPFASLLQEHADEIQGDGFDRIWRRLWRSMSVDRLAPDLQARVTGSSRPRRDVAVGYWRDLLDRRPLDLHAWIVGRLGAVRAIGVPYRVIVGDQLDPLYRTWLASQLPEASVDVLPGSGYFPQVAHPRRFAERIVAFE